ncbi:MAG: hypothetical protein N2651_07870 [Fimbriimonadales bacterium]|nr:hypothetical protein [Fimbriimonadales bacterium]
MRFITSVSLALWMIVAALAVESIAVVPRNSYIVRPVASARELANQIRTEPIVAQRYARHFRRSAWDFAEYVEKELRMTRLSRAQTFNIYYAPPDGRLMVVRRTLPKGTPVFAEKKTGKPILKANCGNPLTPAAAIPVSRTQLPIEITAVATPMPVFTEAITQPRIPTIELVELPVSPVEEVVRAEILPTESLVETLPEAAPEPATPPTLPLSEFVPDNVPPILSRGGPNWLPFLPLISLFTPRGGNDFDPVPEPTSVVILGAGLGLLYPLSRKALKRSQNSSQRKGDSNTHSA